MARPTMRTVLDGATPTSALGYLGHAHENLIARLQRQKEAVHHTCKKRADFEYENSKDEGIFKREVLVDFAPARIMSVLLSWDEA